MTRNGQPGAACLQEGPALRPITEAEFTLFQGLIRREAGIFLIPVNMALLRDGWPVGWGTTPR